MDHEKLRHTAKQAAFAAGDILKRHFRRYCQIDIKNELSPLVTQADREAELAMRAIIRSDFPNHGVIGEEFGCDIPGEADAPLTTWVLDPLDGTSAFVAGLPTFVVLIGVWSGDEPLLGLIYQPITGDMWVALDKGPTMLNENPCRQDYPQDWPLILATTSLDLLMGRTRKAFECLQNKAVTTVYGGDGHLYGSLASGHISIVIEEGLKWHDVAALAPIVIGAGGMISGPDGEDIRAGLEHYTIVSGASKTLHALALDAFREVDSLTEGGYA